MDYYAEPVSIVLDSPDDWLAWDSHIRGLAMCYGILDILLKKKPRPAEPIHPDDLEPEVTNQSAAPNNQAAQDTREQARRSAEGDERTTQVSQSTASDQQARRSAGADLDPKTLYDRQVSRWKRQYKEWEKAENGLRAIWREIEQTVAQRHLRRLTSESDFAIERYWKLKAKLEPKKEDQIS
ncbi:uncharacterized protein P174DRAFT_344679, partial [Aspergillus novofumigatus IBT 16806]